MKATSMAIDRRYHDDSGVEYGVSYDAKRGEITFKHIGEVSFPVDEIPWLIDALYRVRNELPEKPKS